MATTRNPQSTAATPASRHAASVVVAVLAVALAAVSTGCGSSGPTPLSLNTFYGPPAPARQSLGSSAEEPLSRTDVSGTIPPRQPVTAPLPPAQPDNGPIPPSVRNSFNETQSATRQTSGARPATRPQQQLLGGYIPPAPIPVAAPPSSQPAESPMQIGQYMELGSVVAEVNGTPIYANKVLRSEALVLRDYARDSDINKFEANARQLIEQRTDELVNDELEFAAASRALDDDTKKTAGFLASKWRQREVDEAGGSVELAQRRALASGESLEEQVDDQYRSFMVKLYNFKKVFPLAAVSAEDERRYYRDHIDQFTHRSRAVVRLIQKDPAQQDPNDPDGNGRTLALKEIQYDLKRVQAGEDFDELAKSSDLKAIADKPWTLEPHSFMFQKVEAAVWKMQPGQVSDVIEDNGTFFLVKVDSIEHGSVKPFEDETVQNAIWNKLTSQQYMELRQANLQKLKQEAIYRIDPRMIDAAVQMALQNYPRWSK